MARCSNKFAINSKHEKKQWASASASACTTPVNVLWEPFRRKSDEVPARKLAATFWRLQFPFSSFSHSQYHNSREKLGESKDQLSRPITILRSRNALLRGDELNLPCHVSRVRKKWKQKEASKLTKQYPMSFTMNHSKKHLEHKKLVGQRKFGKLREQQNLEAMLDDLKDKLARERISRERIEFMNNKLVHELAEANLLAKKFMTKYEKEKEMIEALCNELATQIGKDKAKLKALQISSTKIYEEVKEGRKMMHVIEEWREGRAQMKLADAQFFLEDKYDQMVKLITFLQMFLISKGAELNSKELEDVKLIKQAIESVNIQQIVELSYDFSNMVPLFDNAQGINDEDTNMFGLTPQRGYTDYHVNVDQDKDISKWKTSPASKQGTITISSSSKSSQHGRQIQRNSTHNMNRHIHRGMKGYIEWPLDIQKSSSKTFHREGKRKKPKISVETKT